MNKIYNYYNEVEIDSEKEIQGRIKNYETKSNELDIRYGMDEINKTVYEKTKSKLENEISGLKMELNKLSPTLSNQKLIIKESLKSLENLNVLWGSINLENKQKLQNTLFPSGIFYNRENHNYLTKEVNSFLLISNSISTYYDVNKEGTNQELIDLSPTVARTRFELVTSGL